MLYNLWLNNLFLYHDLLIFSLSQHYIGSVNTLLSAQNHHRSVMILHLELIIFFVRTLLSFFIFINTPFIINCTTLF